MQSNIAILELTFEYTVWFQRNSNINDSQNLLYRQRERVKPKQKKLKRKREK